MIQTPLLQQIMFIWLLFLFPVLCRSLRRGRCCNMLGGVWETDCPPCLSTSSLLEPTTVLQDQQCAHFCVFSSFSEYMFRVCTRGNKKTNISKSITGFVLEVHTTQEQIHLVIQPHSKQCQPCLALCHNVFSPSETENIYLASALPCSRLICFRICPCSIYRQQLERFTLSFLTFLMNASPPRRVVICDFWTESLYGTMSFSLTRFRNWKPLTFFLLQFTQAQRDLLAPWVFECIKCHFPFGIESKGIFLCFFPAFYFTWQAWL